MRAFKFISAILAAVLCFACSDDESFTTDRNARLAFSADTVSFDTVFYGIGSSTMRLIVYNRGDKGLRLTQVALESGGTSGFLMNVDGQFGATVSNVEVPARDSIFIFLETTVAESAEATRHSTDNILFTLESGVCQRVALDAFGQKAVVLRDELITGDVTLDNALPYLVYDSLVVAPGASLTIKAGAVLHFHKGASLVVHGALHVEGEPGNDVVMRCDRLDKLLWNLPYDLTDAQWGGVMLSSDCVGCDMQYADIHGGSYGVYCDSIAGQLTILNSTIHNVAADALHVRATPALVANSQLTNAFGNCVTLFRAQASFYHCTIAQFYRWSIDRGNAVVMDCPDARFYNCLITGYGDDEVFAQVEGNAEDVNLHFFSCLLNTNASDGRFFTDCIAESKDSATFKLTNFRECNVAYGADFHLDSLSVAIGRANPDYTQLFPIDRNGKPHSADKPDVGCYKHY